MKEFRYLIGWLLLVLLAVVGAGGAVLGSVQSPKTASLDKAVATTLAASSYSQVLTQVAPQGTETDYLTYQAPDRLGGYVQSGNMRTYVMVIGTTEYLARTVSATASTKHLVFSKQQTRGAQAVDPVHNYLRFAKLGTHITQDGNTYSFTLTRGGQTGKLTYTVSGQYVSEFTLKVQGASIDLMISQVGTAPPVALPSGSKVVTGSSALGGTAAG
jgi:hypothetical protein